ncbi:MAG: lipoprotein-releasing ABC transporter permease subunit [Acidobacteriota bacterium]
MRYELFIALRYLKAKRKQAFIAVITIISILGVMVGVGALIVALALMTGFHEDIQSKILGANSHLLVFNANLTQPISNYQALIQQIEEVPNVVAAAEVVYSKGMVSSPFRSEGVVIYGINPPSIRRVLNIFDRMVEGDVATLASSPSAERREKIILGKELAQNLGVMVGEVVKVLSIDAASLSPIGLLPKPRYYEVAGVFESGMWQADSQWAFISFRSAQRFFDLGNSASVIEVRVDDIWRAKEIAQAVREKIGSRYVLQDWMEMNRSFFSALKLEKLLLFIAISLIVAVASLNIIVTLVMMVMEKNKDIGVLMSMGATSKGIMITFMLQGIIIGVLGTLLGCLLGGGLCWLMDTYKLIRLPPDVYTISYLPFKVRVGDLLMIVGVALGISFLATLYPSWRASKLNPVEALRYE